MKKQKVCARCQRTAATNHKIQVLRGVPLGSGCKKAIEKRELIRASGPHSRMVRSSVLGLSHLVSDFGDVCPDEKDHCLQCSFLNEQRCPIEKKYGELFA